MAPPGLRGPGYGPALCDSLIAALILEESYHAVLSATTFCTFTREFSPLGLRSDRLEEDTLAGRRWYLPGRFMIRHGCRYSES